MGDAMNRTPVCCECGDHAWVVLTKGFVALLDKDDAALVGQYSWSAKLYSRHLVYARRGKPPYSMHRLIAKGAVLDHVNGNALDNRRRNLREATHSENMWNRRAHVRATSSRFKGVHFHKWSGLWHARISYEGKRLHLGEFRSESDAAAAYDRAALSLYGEFALTNAKD